MHFAWHIHVLSTIPQPTYSARAPRSMCLSASAMCVTSIDIDSHGLSSRALAGSAGAENPSQGAWTGTRCSGKSGAVLYGTRYRSAID